jgi:RNA polymerase sigma-70 factor (ECF subfamily)
MARSANNPAQRPLEDSGPARHRAAEPAAPSASARRAHRVAATAEALRNLRPAQHRVLIETYYRGRTTEQAAAALGIPARTVKVLLYEALHTLREQLAPDRRIA